VSNFVFTSNRTAEGILDMVAFCANNNCSLTIIEEFSRTPSLNGLTFQEALYSLLDPIGLCPVSIQPGRIIYANGVNAVCVAAPCAPALAWNGSAEDDAIVLHENGTLTGFVYDTPQI
jgi:hypothetical protein